MDNAPVSKTGDSRFESWLPRLTWSRFEAGPVGNDSPVIAYVLFFLAGLGFGYAAPPRWKWLPLLFPLVLGIGAIINHGLDGSILLRLVIALIITALGILVGTVLDARGRSRSDHPRYA